MIRVVGGTFKHRLLNQPSLETTRCTKDMAKEGLFNSLGDLTNLSFLDLFSGSGAIGIEAYSRGAKPVVLNEKDKLAKKVILGNLISLGISDINLYNLDANDCLNELAKKGIVFDVIFLDPPYKFIMDQEYVEKFIKLNLVKENSRIILETDYLLNIDEFNLYNIKVLKYGKSYMNILRRK